jgi:sortase A
MQAGVELPWPIEPALCPSCQRWVGRGRALSAEAASQRAIEGGAASAPDDESASNGHASQRGRRPRPGSAERRRARTSQAPTTDGEAPAGDGRADHDGDGAVDGHAAGAPPTVIAASGADAGVAEPVVESDADVAPADGATHAEAEDESADVAAAEAPAASDGDDPAAPAEDGQALASEPPQTEAPADGGHGAAQAQDHTMPFPVVTEEPKERRRLPFLRRKASAAVAEPSGERPKRSKLMRALPIVLLVIGVLLLAEAAITVLWKEPISALLTASGQSALGDDLEKMEQEADAEAAKNRKQMVRYQHRAAVKLNRDAGTSKPIGRLRVPKIGLNMVVVQGVDEETSLTKGPGHYPQTPLPGQKGAWTTGIAGHRTTYDAPFRRNNELKRGNKIIFTLPYGRFTYEVTKTRIVDAGYQKAFVPQGRDMIVLTACHPLYSAAQRILVYGKLTKTEARGKAKSAAGA